MLNSRSCFTNEEPRETPVDESLLQASERFEEFTYKEKSGKLFSTGLQNVTTTLDEESQDYSFN